MIETLRHIIAPRPQSQLPEGGSEESIESVALAGAAAIQRLIADRDTLRDRVNTQQRELVTLSAANEELRCRLGLIRQQYLELGSRILTQLEQFDRITREAIQDYQAPLSTPQDDANLIALAHRLKPNNGPA
jgi:hypothetical protein